MAARQLVGFIGGGLMAVPMARRVQASELFAVSMANRTRERIAPLAAHGVQIAESAQQAARDAQRFVVLMVTDGPASLSIVRTIGTEMRNKVLVNMSTISVAESRECDALVRGFGGSYVESPVMGSVPQATDGKLKILVCAPSELASEVTPLLSHMGIVNHVGAEIGTGATLKLAVNTMIGAEIAGLVSALSIVSHAGIPLETYTSLLTASPLNSMFIEGKIKKILSGDYSPTFSTSMIAKDMNLAAGEAARVGADNSHLQHIAQLYDNAAASGNAEKDLAAAFLYANREMK